MILFSVNAFSFTVKWKVGEGAGLWSNMYIYAWGGSPVSDTFGGWPGTPATLQDGWYSVTVPEGQTVGNLIINNNAGQQLPDITGVTADACFQINLTNLSYISVNCVESPSFTVKWKVTEGNWANMYAYSWGGWPVSDIFGGWPGTSASLQDDWYSITVPENQRLGNLIINNNAGQQLPDIEGLTADACFEIDVTGLIYTPIECPAPPQPEPATVHVRLADGLDWTLHMYLPNDANGEWPGDELTPDAEGWYTLDFSTGIPAFVVFNNGFSGGNSQTQNITFLTDGNCYEISTATDPTYDNRLVNQIDCPTTPPEPGDPATIHVKLAEGLDWTLHMYLPNNANGEWPGNELTPGTDGWYVINFPTGIPAFVVFNNGFSGGNSQTQNITFLTDGNCYEISTATDPTYDNRLVNQIDCPGTSIIVPITSKSTISPNPATTNVTINGVQAIRSVTIRNVAGQTVAKPTVKGNTVEISNLASGIYFLEVQSLEGNTETLKLIKK